MTGREGKDLSDLKELKVLIVAQMLHSNMISNLYLFEILNQSMSGQ